MNEREEGISLELFSRKETRKEERREKTHLLQVPKHILRQLLEQHPKQSSQQRTREIQPLLPEMISIVEFSTFQSGEEESMDHVTEEVGFLGFEPFVGRDVRKHLLLEDLVGVPKSTILGEVGSGSSSSDEVEGDLGGEGREKKRVSEEKRKRERERDASRRSSVARGRTASRNNSPPDPES